MYSVMLDGKQYVATTGYKTRRRYFKTVNVPAEYEYSVLPNITSNTSYGSVTASTEGKPAFQAVDGNASTWWEIGATTTGWWQWKLPNQVNIVAISISVRIGDRPNLTARVYTSSSKTTAIGNSINTNVAGEKKSVVGIPEAGIETDTIYIDCSSTQDYLGIGEIEITTRRTIKDAYSYDVEVAEGEPYDRFSDEVYLDRMGVNI